MAIAFVKLGGVGGAKTVSVTSFSVTVPAGGHAAGNQLAVSMGISESTTNDQTYTVTDTRSNTYLQIEGGPIGDGDAVFTGLWVSTLTTTLQAGDTVTVTRTVGTSLADKWAVVCAEFSGASTTEDVASLVVQTAGAVTTPSIGPITPVSAATLILACVFAFNRPTGDTFTQDSDTVGGAAWTLIGSGGTTGGSAATNSYLRFSYKITTSAAAQTYNPTVGTAASLRLALAAVSQPVAAAVKPIRWPSRAMQAAVIRAATR